MAASGTALVQWVDVDHLWLHQPWRVDAASTSMLQANLQSVFANAESAGVDIIVVTWVFQSTQMQDLVRGLLPAGTPSTSIQLLADADTWRRRFQGDPSRPRVDAFFVQRYRDAQDTPCDHTVETGQREPAEIAFVIASLLELSFDSSP